MSSITLAVSALAAMLALVWAAPAPHATVVSIRGDVRCVRGNISSVLKRGDELRPGDRITAADGEASISLPDGLFEICPQSGFQLSAHPESALDRCVSAVKRLFEKTGGGPEAPQRGSRSIIAVRG